MTPQAVAFAASAGFLLAGAAVSLLALARARALLRSQPAVAPSPAREAAVELLRQKLEALEQEVRELARCAPAAAAPSPPRAAFNLEKRSHALRLHRRGEPPARIASALELPLQEVELLIKVHRVVLRNL